MVSRYEVTKLFCSKYCFVCASSARSPCNLGSEAYFTICLSESEYGYCAYPDPVPLLLAVPFVIREKSWESIDVVEHSYPPDSLCGHSCNSSLRNSSSSSFLLVLQFLLSPTL